MSNATIRRARPDEAVILSDLALRSKAHWGYDEGFLERCRDELTISPGYIVRCPVYVHERAGDLHGFYGLDGSPPVGELAYVFVEPEWIGHGFGRDLVVHALGVARSLGYRELVVESDPGAEGFYRAMGADRIGERASDIAPERMLPVLRFRL